MRWIVGLMESTSPADLSSQAQELIGQAYAEPSIESLACKGSAAFAVRQPAWGCVGTGIVEEEVYMVTGDVDLYNRQAVASALQRDGYAPANSSDDLSLILAAYRTWGCDMFRHLEGEYSIFLWDGQRTGLLMARDPMGIMTAFYRPTENGVRFSTDLGQLVGTLTFAELDPDYFAAYRQTGGMIDGVHTPYQSCRRVPRGHWLWCEQNGLQLHRFWDLGLDLTPIEYAREESYAEHLRELLLQAVQASLSTDRPNAVLMSGGLDSSTIFALGKILERKGMVAPVTAISAVFDRYRQADERSYIRAITDMYRCRGIEVVADDLVLYKDFPDDAPWTDEPYLNGATYAFNAALFQAARAAEAARVITGYGGDHLLAGSPDLIADLIRTGQMARAAESVWQYADGIRVSAWNVLLMHGLRPLARWPQADRRPEFRRVHQRQLYGQFEGTVGRLFTDRVVAPTARVRLKHPFLDRRLWEFMIRIPGDLRWRAGQRKYILRQAMKGLLPAAVLDRMNKTEHTGIIFEGFRRNWPALWAGVQQAHVAAMGLTDRDSFLSGLQALRQGQEPRPDLMTLMALELWLFKVGLRSGHARAIS